MARREPELYSDADLVERRRLGVRLWQHRSYPLSIVELILATTTKTGLTVRCQLEPADIIPAALPSSPELARQTSYRMSKWPRSRSNAPNPWRVELHHLTKSSSPKPRVYLVTDP